MNTTAQRSHGALPSPAEQVVLESFAREATALGRALVETRQLRLERCASLDLANSANVEFLLLSIRMAAKAHLRRGEGLFALIDRADAMVDAARGAARVAAGGKMDVGLQVLRAIAMAEVLDEESRGRFARNAALRALADATMTQLVAGFAARFGGTLPAEVQRAFPRFAAALREAWRPVQARRGLLLWLTKRS